MNNKVDEILARVRLQDEARKQERAKLSFGYSRSSAV